MSPRVSSSVPVRAILGIETTTLVLAQRVIDSVKTSTVVPVVVSVTVAGTTPKFWPRIVISRPAIAIWGSIASIEGGSVAVAVNGAVAIGPALVDGSRARTPTQNG